MTSTSPSTKGQTISGVFSKSEALYAPLKDYEPSSKGKKKKTNRKLPRSLREPALVEFLCLVSKDIHRCAPAASIGKNNGGRPVGESVVEDRVRERGMTLVSGYNQAPTTGKRKKNEQHASIVVSNRKRKRLRERQNMPKSFPFSEGDQTMMEQINQRWNEYIRRILPSSRLAKDGGKQLAETKQKEVFERIQKCELVGASVKIEECRQQPHLKAKSGFVVEVTKRTWRLLLLATEKGYHSKLIMVPKVGSVLSVVVVHEPRAGSAMKSTISIHGDELVDANK